jgi:hypothetical protein
VRKARLRSEKEQEQNKEILDKHKGGVVVYGTEVMLMHRDSGSLLMSINESSQTDQIGYKVELHTDLNSKMLFKLQPKYKSTKTGTPISYSDSVHIVNAMTGNYLTVALQTHKPPLPSLLKNSSPLM